MGMLEEDFDPTAYRDAYREQVLALVDAKAKGKKTKLKLVKPKPRTDDLKAALAASIGARGKEKIRATA